MPSADGKAFTDIINRSSSDLGYVAFEEANGRSLFMLNAGDVVTVYNVKVRTIDKQPGLDRAGSDSQSPADGDDDRD